MHESGEAENIYLKRMREVKGVRLFQNDGQVMELWELSHHQPVL